MLLNQLNVIEQILICFVFIFFLPFFVESELIKETRREVFLDEKKKKCVKKIMSSL